MPAKKSEPMTVEQRVETIFEGMYSTNNLFRDKIRRHLIEHGEQVRQEERERCMAIVNAELDDYPISAQQWFVIGKSVFHEQGGDDGE